MLWPRRSDPTLAAEYASRSGFVSLQELEALAERRLGRAAFDYFAGGSADEQTLRDNRAAFDRWRIEPRVLRDLDHPSIGTTVLGTPMAMPVLIAPLAYQRVAHDLGDLATARAAATAGVVHVLSTLSNHRLEEVAAAAPGAPRWFQLYPLRDEGATRAVVERAEAAGFGALVLTVDTTAHGRRERDMRNSFALPDHLELPCVPVPAGHTGPVTPTLLTSLMEPALGWGHVQRLRATSRLPILLKGVLSPRDAKLAVEHGVAGVIVSNHGGRQLDGVPATVDALPRIADAVGDRLELLLDGGVRRGTDVLKALALGARAVLVGRPITYGLALGGEAGVREVLSVLADEVATALALAGCASPADAVRELVYRDAVAPT